MSETKTIHLPAIGDFDEIEIIEVLVASGDQIEQEDSIIVLESDKATMEIPSPYAGRVMSVKVAVGDKISEGSEIATLETIDSDGESSATEEKESTDRDEESVGSVEESSQQEGKHTTENEESGEIKRDTSKTDAAENSTSAKSSFNQPADAAGSSGKLIHASPSIRRYARELGVDLVQVEGSGARGRILKEDVKAFIKTTLKSGSSVTGGGIEVAAMPDIDFARFGEIESVDLNRIKKKSGAHLHRSWVTVPHVTQFDEAEITELEVFRKSLAKEAGDRGVRLTPLVFLMKAAVASLKSFPEVNASLDSSAEKLILKKYFNIGVAVDTPDGLVVPVIRDVDRKGVFELAEELASAADRARQGKLCPGDMQGGCFSISSLGGIGGTHFTPIVNAPEVAILGVGKARMQPVYEDDGSFRAGLILPLALSYDHRVIDGAQGARFISDLGCTIADIRRVLI
jgi:pyruvate dehydrogenase E2 component (dihydrolipoamide acetyltransferase)